MSEPIHEGVGQAELTPEVSLLLGLLASSGIKEILLAASDERLAALQRGQQYKQIRANRLQSLAEAAVEALLSNGYTDGDVNLPDSPLAHTPKHRKPSVGNTTD